MPLRNAIERSISPSSRTKTTPKASIVVPTICVMMLLRLTGVKKLFAVRLKTMTMIVRPIITGALPRLPPLMFSHSRVPKLSNGGSTLGVTSIVSVVTRSLRLRR